MNDIATRIDPVKLRASFDEYIRDPDATLDAEYNKEKLALLPQLAAIPDDVDVLVRFMRDQLHYDHEAARLEIEHNITGNLDVLYDDDRALFDAIDAFLRTYNFD